MVAGRVQADELFELLCTLNTSAFQWSGFLAKQGQRTVSLKQPAPEVPLTPENATFHESKSVLLEAANQLIRLVRGPRETLLALSFEHCATTSLQVALKYKFANVIPLHGTTTYEKIAQDVGQGVTTALVERIVQHCASFGLFDAIPGGFVGHNDVSALLVTDPDIEAWMYLNATIAFPAGAKVPKAIEQYGYSMEANESAYGVSIDRKISQFSHFREPDNKKNHEMFARAMRGIARGGAYDIGHVIDGGYPWERLQEGNGHLIVDVGGGPGHVIMGLAKKYPELRFEVQDLPETVAVGAEACDEALRPRIAFRAHDFMTPQPTHKVDKEGIVYFCRFILHDWSDKYATQIVQQLAYGLRSNDRIILNEVLVPEPGKEPREIERRMHDRDLLMLMNLNGRERTITAFQEICQSVTPKLTVANVVRPKQGELSLIEITLDGAQATVNGNGVAQTNGNGVHENGNGVNGHTNGYTNGVHPNGVTNGAQTNGIH